MKNKMVIGRTVPGTLIFSGKGLLVSKLDDFNFCPLRRIRYPLNQQKVRTWRWSCRKNKNYYDQSRNVYEKKETWTK